MSSRHLVSGAAFLVATAVQAVVAPSAFAQTKDPAAFKLACVQASDKAQQLRVAGKLVAARDTLRTCVLDACPAVVREACTQWLGEVSSSLPSIVIGAKESDGKDILDLKVSIDGVLVTEHLGGRALPIDPGRHMMRYEKADGAVVEQEILVGEGNKNREVAVVFPGAAKAGAAGSNGSPGSPAEAAPVGPKVASTANTAIGITFAAIGAGALGTALYLDLKATSNVNALQLSKCAPHCSTSQVSSDELDYDLAGVGLGIGIVAVGVATYVLIAHPFGDSPSPPARGFRIVPSPHGSGFAFTF